MKLSNKTMLDEIYFSVGESDDTTWKPAVKGLFSVNFFYKVLKDISGRVEGWQSFWDPSVLPRVCLFCGGGKET